VKGFRVDLTNINSDFRNETFKWDCVLHQGSGKNANKCLPKIENVETMIRSWNKSILKEDKRFDNFKEEIEDLKVLIPDHLTFQKLYCKLLKDDKLLSPMDVLEKIRDIVDKYYPKDGFKEVMISNEGALISINRPEIPLRIMMALYGCLFITETIRP